MIIDCHTHIWSDVSQLGPAAVRPGRVHRGMEGDNENWPGASADTHLRGSEPVSRAFVFGFKSRHLGAEIPNNLIRDYIRQQPEKMIGVAGVDPTNLDEALEDLDKAAETYGMKGITVSPSAQDFHPADSRAMQVFSEAHKRKFPVFVHQGLRFAAASKMEFARPTHLDEVARELPQLKIVVAHMGFPWIDECIVMLGKHENVYADISGLIHRPWHAYNALLSAYQYGVMDKLLFGSDFPFTQPAKAIESIYRLNQLVTGTNLPTIPRQYLAGIVERDALNLLGIESNGFAHSEPSNGNAILSDDA